jgi:CO/xanthine dehydrogenase Mo-binding subunit
VILEKNIVPDDFCAKVSGRARYLADLKCEGALEAVTVRSKVPHGIIRGVVVPELPPDCFVVGAKDVPGVNETLMFAGQPIFADREVRWLGEPVLLLLAPDKRTASELAAQVRLEIEELPALMTFDEAIEKAAPYMDWQNGFGDVEAAFSKAARVVETRVETGAQEHLYMEPQGAWPCRARTAASLSTPPARGLSSSATASPKLSAVRRSLSTWWCLPWAAASAARKTLP